MARTTTRSTSGPAAGPTTASTDQPTPATAGEAVDADSVDVLLAEVRRRVEERARGLVAQGRRLDLAQVEDLADRMVAALPTVHPLDQPLAPFYDTTGLVSWLGISRQALFDRVRRGTVLACRTADGHLVYPSLQFGRTGQVRPGVQEAVGAFTRAGVDGWVTGTWLTTPSEVFDGESAVDYLVVHRSSAAAVARVASAAAADAARWAA
ncbi:MAG TPA: hypothetical protein VFM86_14880 [Pedococcus sp.]|nr:hypothetical protein [Pedococcus sp.]